jgi:hypothetical protein
MENKKLFGKLRNKYHIIEILSYAYKSFEANSLLFKVSRGLRSFLISNFNIINEKISG